MANETGVRIGNYHTWEDFGVEWYDLDLGTPEVKTHVLELPLESGNIDLSETVTGRPCYGSRTIRMYFAQEDYSPTAWIQLCSSMTAAFHGKRLLIAFDFDPDYYYLGRITCDTDKKSFAVSQYIITAVCDPYKYYRDVTERTVTVDGTTDVTLDNMDMIVSPTFTTEAKNITVSCNGEAALSIFPVTDFNIPEILLLPGANQLKFTGSGVVTIRYQEGTL